MSHSTGGVPLQYSWYMYTVLTFRPEYQYPLYFHIFFNAHPAAAYLEAAAGAFLCTRKSTFFQYGYSV